MLDYNEIRKKIEGFKGSSDEGHELQAALFEETNVVREALIKHEQDLAEEFKELVALVTEKIQEAVEREGEEGIPDPVEEKPGNGRDR